MHVFQIWSNYVPDGSAGIVSGTALDKLWRTEEREDRLVLAGSEVGDLVDLVDLVLFSAELVEGLKLIFLKC